jgi:hypothetical protein
MLEYEDMIDGDKQFVIIRCRYDGYILLGVEDNGALNDK